MIMTRDIQAGGVEGWGISFILLFFGILLLVRGNGSAILLGTWITIVGLGTLVINSLTLHKNRRTR